MITYNMEKNVNSGVQVGFGEEKLHLQTIFKIYLLDFSFRENLSEIKISTLIINHIVISLKLLKLKKIIKFFFSF